MIKSPIILLKKIRRKIDIKSQKQKVVLETSEKVVNVNNYFYVSLILKNSTEFKNLSIQMDYDSNIMEHIFSKWISIIFNEKPVK